MKQDIETKAIQEIIVALEMVPAERLAAVLDYVCGRFGVKIGANKQAQETTDIGASGGSKDAIEIKRFLKDKAPDNSYQQVAVLAYFLRKMNNEDEVNSKSIEEANKKALGSSIDDATAVLNDAKGKYGFFISGATGKKRLSAFGEEVVEALPDQAKVKELLKKRKKKRKSKKKA